MSEPSPPKRRRLPRFSLRSLLLAALLAASGFGLWLHWLPWIPWIRIDGAEISPLPMLEFTPDGRKILAFSYSEVRVWDVDSRRRLEEREGHQSAKWDYDWTPHGIYHAAAGEDALNPMPQDWNDLPYVQALRERLKFSVRNAPEPVPLIDAVASLNKVLAGKGLENMKIELEEGPAAVADRFLVQLPAEGAFLESVEQAGRTWSLKCLVERNGIHLLLKDSYPGKAKELFKRDCEESIRIWNMETGELVVHLADLGSRIRWLDFRGQGRFLLAALGDGRGVLFDTGSWRKAKEFALPVELFEENVSVSRDGMEVAVADPGKAKPGMITLNATARPVLANEAHIDSLAPDDRRIVRYTQGGQLAIHDVSDNSELYLLPAYTDHPAQERLVLFWRSLIGYEEDDGAAQKGKAKGPVVPVKQTSLFATPRFSADGERVYGLQKGAAVVWQRRRPEWWWGVAWLPEFWMTFAFAAAFLWSLWKDRKAIAGR